MMKFKVEVDSSLGPARSDVNVIDILNLSDHCFTSEKWEQYC